MSAGVYYRGELLADSLAEGELPYLTMMTKLHVSPCQRIAYTYTGDRILFRHHKALMERFVEMIRLKELDDPKVDQTMYPINQFMDSRFIIISRERAYTYCDLGLRETDGPELMGTHGLALLVLRQLILPKVMKKFTKKAYDKHGAMIANKLYGNQTGPVFPVMACLQSDLKPFERD